MYVEDVKKYEGRRVLIILSNKFKYTAVLPKLNGTTFTIVDKYGHEATIDCDMIQLITEVKNE